MIRQDGWRLDNTYARLPETLFAAAEPARVQRPRLAILNRRLADELGLQLAGLSPDEAAALFAGQQPPPGSQAIAQAYAGHQYGHFTMLGDGRAILMGEHRTPDGRLVDVQLKGPGRTVYSRGGDGRAALGPMLREYIISEAMAALGIPTTRSLAVVTTGEPVFRERMQKGAILTRVAASHIRVGTFEYAARRGEPILRTLADYTIERHFPELADAPNKHLAFLKAVAERQAALIAKWQLVGFIHGVMNTDNMAISGETIDYGPCAFMNAYRTDTVYSSIDRGGRYAYGNQPAIAQWNLTRFAETLLPLMDSDPEKSIPMATEALEEFPSRFEHHWLAGMRRKLGLRTEAAGDAELVQTLLEWMEKHHADFTNTFRDLSSDEMPGGERYRDPDLQSWQARWRDRLRGEADAVGLMRSANPFVIPRNHRVEAALVAAEERDDLSVLHELLSVLANPFDASPAAEKYRDPPSDETGYRTFCGT